MQRFFFTTLKNHLPVQLPASDPASASASASDPASASASASAPAPRAQPRMMIMTGQLQPRNIRVAAPAAPANNNMLSRNIRDSQPIFSVSSIFGLKQGSCSSCGHWCHRHHRSHSSRNCMIFITKSYNHIHMHTFIFIYSYSYIHIHTFVQSMLAHHRRRFMHKCIHA